MEVDHHCRVAANPNPEHRTRIGAAGLGLCLIALAALGLAGAPGIPSAEAASCPNAGAKPGKLSTKEARKAIICLINKRRANAGRGPLDRDSRLQRAAQRHNSRMHGTGCFSHQCPGEGSLGTRVRSVGYLNGARRWSYAENVAWGRKGRGTPAAIVRAWMRSSGHRANILSGKFRDLGVGFDDGTPRSKRASGGIFTVDFGLRSG